MAQWIIYGSNGVAKAKVKELELHDEWMAECFLTVSIKNATPISFAVGDYIDYRGERYTIQYDPNVIKKATSGSYGEGFTYDNIKFVGLQDEVVRCDFNDLVLNDNDMHYSALPTFPFYCESVDDLLDRIQANLEDLYPGQWIVIGLNTVRNSQRGTAVGRAQAFVNAYKQYIDPTGAAHTEPYGKQGVAETADHITCWDAMKKVHDDFDLNFIVRGRVIVVGTAGVFTANTFRYGKGNGLKEIERIGESDQRIVTRLRAYGSEENLPAHYYNTVNKQVYANVISILHKFDATGADFLLNLDFDKKYFTYRSESYPGTTEAPNYIIEMKANDVTVRGYVTKDATSGKCYVYCESVAGDDDRDEPDATKMAAFVEALTANDRLDFVDYVNRDAFGEGHYDYATSHLPDNMAVSRLMLPGFPTMSLNAWVQAHKNDADKTWLAQAIADGFTFSTEIYRPYIDSPNKIQYGVRPGSVYFDGSDETENIHPTIEGMTYNDAPIDEIYAADQVEDNGVYPAGEEVKPIKITLPNLGFSLDKYYEDGASIDMKNGMCGARSFKLTGKPKKNNDNRWVCEVERVHDDSLDLWFPYSDFQIHGSSEVGRDHGDKYVLTGIDMPDAYIDAAAVKLLQYSIEALKKNHAPRYTYQPSIDNIFMQRQHDTASASQGVVSLHDTLKAGDVFAFADTDLNIDANVIIDILTIRENGDNGIPSYEVTLRDEKQVGTIQKITNKVDSIISGATSINGATGGGLTTRQIQSLINRYGGEQFLSKLNDDTAAGYITFLKGLQIGANFIPDILGEGGVLRMRDDGKVELVTDILYARVKAYFDSVEIREYQHTGGNRIASVAGNRMCRIEWYDANNEVLEQTQANLSSVAYFRCYFRASDGEDTVRNNWVVGDLAYCHVTSMVNSSDNPEQEGLNQKHLWRLVIGRNTEGTLTEDGEAYIDLSNRATETISGTSYIGYQSGSDAPEAQDDIIQLGNVNDTTRQGAIVEFVTGTDAPSYQIYQGINSFSLNNKNQIGFGYNTSTGRAYLNVYGDAYVGARDRSTFIEYKQSGTGGNPELNIKAHVEFTNTDQELDTLVQAHQKTYDNAIAALIRETEDLQAQIDGAIESYFMEGVPSLTTPPVMNTEETHYEEAWLTGEETQEERIAILNKHIGDLYYDKQTRHGYRFLYDDDTSDYVWAILTDEDVTEALRLASEAQETADGKSTTFLNNTSDQDESKRYPTNYKKGDTWILQADATIGTTAYKAGDILTASTDSETYSASHWSKQVRYTDDTKADSILNNTYYKQLAGGTINNLIGTAQDAADAAQDAADAAQADATNANNKLTAWADDGNISPTEKLALKNQKADVQKEYAQIITDAAKYSGVSTTAFTTAYNRAITAFDYYTSTSTENVDIITDEEEDSDETPRYSRIAAYYAARQTILEAITTAAKTYATTQGNKFLNDAVYKAISAALGSKTDIVGGLVLTSMIGMRQNTGTAQEPSYKVWGGINGEYDDWSGETHAKGHGIAAWYGGELLDKETLNTEQIAQGWDTLRWAKGVDRFDGSGYRANGNITWDETGALTIKNITTLSDSNNNNILNELATFNSAFTFGTSGQGSTTALYITPQVPFESLYIGTSNANKKEVATQEWVGNNYVSTAFFRQLFRAFKPNETAGQADVEVQPNTIDATISNIKAMVGFWTEQYISALGNNSDGGGGGASVLYGLNDVTPNATGDGVMGAQDGYVLTYNGTTNHWYAAATAETYVLPQATVDALGGIKIGYTTSGKNYAIALDTNGRAYVNVPWTDHYDWGDITNTPTTIAGYGITDAYTKTEVDSLVRLKSVAFSSDGVLAFTLQDGSVSYVDLTHQHNFQEILERPTTLAGFGIDDAKIESGVITLGNNTITPVTSVAMIVPTGFSISGTPISKTGTLALSYSSGYEGFTTELKNMITALYSWFEVDSNGDIKTKDYTSNGTTKHRGFWSPSFISALGQGSDSGGGGQGDVTWELLKTQATDDRYIHLSYISAALESYLTTNNYVQSSDISDMATKTWVGNQGYLTQQSLSSYYTKSEVDALARLTNVAYSSDGILALTHQDGSTTYADFTHEHSFLELLDRPTTIAGYEISDIYINSGVVYIGDSSITPVTSVAMTVPTGFSISGSPISKTGTLAVSYASGYEGFTTSLKEKIEALFSWFELDSDGNVKTKDYVDNGTTKHRGFWSESFISALGEGNDGGGGGQGDVTWALLASTATGGRTIDISYLTAALNGYATQSWVQSQGYITQAAVDVLEFLNTVTGGSDILTLTTNKGNSTIVDFTHNHEFLELTDRPTTIAGYGIEDAKIVNGVITLGTNTITPLTSHQSVTNNNISVTWNTETTIATIGSTAIKIKIPANPDTNTWRNIFKDGTEQLATGINTKGLNFVGDGKTTITFLAAGTGEGQSGNANYATLKIGSTWRGIQDNLTSDSSTDSLSAKQGKALKGSITTLEGYFNNDAAKKADKLTTARSLWGNDFDGSAAITSSIIISTPKTGESDKYLQIGDIKLIYDATNNALHVEHTDATKVASFYAQGAISALGQGVDGGGGGQGDVTWALLADNTDTRQIALSHLTDALSGYSTTGHTHTTTIATDSGTNQLTLAYGTKYKITAGGTSFIFTMPSADDTNTWRNIYVAGTEKIGSAVNTKGLNFAAGSNVSLSFTAAGSGTGQNANYGTITISATDTTYSVATQSANGLMSAADKTKLDGLEYFNAAPRSSDGVVTLTTNKSNTTILDLTHQHSFLELVDRPTTLAGYGITDAVASIVINGTSYLPTNKVVTLPVYTSTQVDALARLKTLALTNDGLLTFTHQDNSISVVDFSHEHSFLELIDRPTTVAGYGITDMSSQSVNYATSAGSVAWTNVSSRPTKLSQFTNDSGYITSSGSCSYATSAGAVAWGNVTSNPFTIGGSVTDAYVNGTTYSTLNNGTYTHQLSGSSESVVHFQCGGSASGLDLKFHYPQSSDSPIYYRKTIDSNRFASTSWVTLIDSLNIGSQSVNYATSAGKATNDSDGNAINSTYLKKSGGTLSGNVYINPSNGNDSLISVTNTNQSGTAIYLLASTNRGVYHSTAGWLVATNGTNSWMGIGNVGIGNSSPSYKLDVSGTGHFTGHAYFDDWIDVTAGVATQCVELDPPSGSSHGGYIDFHFNSSSADYTSRIIETASGTVTLYGNFYASGGVTCASDIRLKDIVGDANLSVEQIAAAPAVTFFWKKDHSKGLQVGSIAQYWQTALPQSVTIGGDGELGLQYGVAALVAAITTARKVVDHEKRITELEKERDAWKEAYSFIKNAYEELKLKIA